MPKASSTPQGPSENARRIEDAYKCALTGWGCFRRSPRHPRLRQFVEKVIVHETVKDEDGERSREIEVYLNFIGKFDVPVQSVELSPEEQKRQEALKKRRIHERNKRVQKRQERMNAQLKNESPI